MTCDLLNIPQILNRYLLQNAPCISLGAYVWLAPMPQVCDYTAESYSYVGLALQSGSEEDKEQSSETGSELRDDEWPKRGVFNHSALLQKD